MKNKDDCFEYDDNLDTLHIFEQGYQEDMEGSIVFGDFVFDVSKTGRVMGVEIDSASSLFKTTPEFMKNNINSTFLECGVRQNILFLGFGVILKGKEMSFNYMMPRNQAAFKNVICGVPQNICP